ncbi:MAG TPA: TIGR03067 domain-containing protein, partial [Urbifossiella sp.]|nr:TIGR03067 domain-containing protein [Urbifossiella sp.]
MRAAPLLTAAALAAGLVSFSALSGQPPAGKAEKGAAAELAKFRGDWVITKIVPPPGEPAPPEAVLKSVTIEVRDNRVTAVITQGGDEPRREYALLKLDPTKTPNHIDLTGADKTHTPFGGLPTAGKSKAPLPPPVMSGLYKFEGDALVVAFPTEPELGRPGGFNPVAPK